MRHDELWRELYAAPCLRLLAPLLTREAWLAISSNSLDSRRLGRCSNLAYIHPPPSPLSTWLVVIADGGCGAGRADEGMPSGQATTSPDVDSCRPAWPGPADLAPHVRLRNRGQLVPVDSTIGPFRLDCCMTGMGGSGEYMRMRLFASLLPAGATRASRKSSKSHRPKAHD